MATATATAEKRPDIKSDETEKERADRLQKEFLDKNPSTLLVNAPKNEVDRLTADEGVPIVDTPTASLPGGGPANNFGMSAGGPVPTKQEVQDILDQTPQSKKAEDKKHAVTAGHTGK